MPLLGMLWFTGGFDWFGILFVIWFAVLMVGLLLHLGYSAGCVFNIANFGCCDWFVWFVIMGVPLA